MGATVGEDFKRWEAFYDDGGAHDGALLRRYRDGLLHSRIAFSLPDGQWYRAESRIEVDPDGSAWAGAHYRQEPGGVDARLTTGGPGEKLSLPSYAEFLLVRRLAGGEAGPIAFARMADGDPDEAAASASVQREPATTITAPGGAVHEVQMVTVREGDAVANTHWIADGQVLGSDWNGATSWLVEGPAQALAGLPAPMVAFLRSGFDPAAP